LRATSIVSFMYPDKALQRTAGILPALARAGWKPAAVRDIILLEVWLSYSKIRRDLTMFEAKLLSKLNFRETYAAVTSDIARG